MVPGPVPLDFFLLIQFSVLMLVTVLCALFWPPQVSVLASVYLKNVKGLYYVRSYFAKLASPIPGSRTDLYHQAVPGPVLELNNICGRFQARFC